MTGDTSSQPHVTLAAAWLVSTILSQDRVLVLIFSQSVFYFKSACSPRGCVGFLQGLTCKWICDSKLPSRIVNMLTLMDWKSIQTVSLPLTECRLGCTPDYLSSL